MLLAVPGAAQDSPKPEPVGREVLCLYDSSQFRSPSEFRNNYTWQFAQVVFDYLGMVSRYHDLKQPLPPDSRMTGVRAIFFWAYNPKIPRPDDWCRWLARQSQRGKRLILFLGPPFVDSATGRPVEAAPFAEMLKALGIAYEGELPGATAPFEVVSQNPEMMEFERKLDPVLPLDARYRSIGRENRVHLKVRRLDRKDADLDLAVTGPNGGLVFEPAALYVDHLIAQSRWKINPFRFFEEAAGLTGLPRPDITTLYGRRIYFSHIDGDGIENKVLDSKDGRETCPELFKREFLEKYPLPVTIALIAYDVEKSEETARIGRELFAMKNVEPGVHAYAHPLDWWAGTLSYDKIPGYRVGGFHFDLGRETRHAVEVVQKLELPEGGKVRLFQWTGDRNPPEAAIEMLDEIGVDNLNIEDVFLDDAHPSYTFVKPAFLPVGERMQYGARASSENLYTRLWTKHFWAFRNVRETYERTGAPIRICPINLYHHFYVVENRVPREVLHELYRWVLSQPIHAVTAAGYVQVLKGFQGAKIAKTSDGGWEVSDYGACRTIRFDREERNVDLEASRGVIGFTHELGCLYVHLDGGPAKVMLTREAPKRPYLMEASGEARLVERDSKLDLTVNSQGPVAWSVGGLPELSRWQISWTLAEGARQTKEAEVRQGRLSLSLEPSGRVEFVLERK